MNAELFIDTLSKTLLPFTEGVYPEGHKFMQDNDPKHSSNMTKSGWRTSQSICGRLRQSLRTLTQ